MSVTAVPLRPISKDVLPKLWIGVALLLLVAGAFAWWTTAGVAAVHGSAEDFLAWNGGRSGVTTTDSGLQYSVLEEPDDTIRPVGNDGVIVNYTGRLRDGEEFDSGEAVGMRLGGVVPGFDEALRLMGTGGQYRIWIPPALGYGDNPPPGAPIPPGSILEFDVEVLQIVPGAEIDRMLQMQMQQQMGEQGLPGAP